MRGGLYAESNNTLHHYALSVFKAYWTDDKDISSNKVLEDICFENDLDSKKFFEFIDMPSTKQELIDNSKDLIEKGGFVYAHWDGASETEELIKKETKATIRCIPLDSSKEFGKCIYSNKPSSQRVLFAKAY